MLITTDFKLKEKLLEWFENFNKNNFMNSYWNYEIENNTFTIVYRISKDDYSVDHKSSFSNEALARETMDYERFSNLIHKIFSFESYYTSR